MFTWNWCLFISVVAVGVVYSFCLLCFKSHLNPNHHNCWVLKLCISSLKAPQWKAPFQKLLLCCLGSLQKERKKKKIIIIAKKWGFMRIEPEPFHSQTQHNHSFTNCPWVFPHYFLAPLVIYIAFSLFSLFNLFS